jgi:hypothetical protein
VFAGGALWWAAAVGLRPDYAGAILGGMLLTGIGVGLTLPAVMATAATSLPAHAFASGSATVNMVRQVGIAVGVAVLIAVVGTSGTALGRLTAFRHAWIVIAVIAVLGTASSALLRRPAAPAC